MQSTGIAQMSPVVKLADGGQPILFRPGRPQDASMLRQMHARLSTQSLYNRYFGLRRPMDVEEALSRLHTDGEHAAIVAVSGTTLIALGELDRVESTVAKVSLLVDDRFQGLGVGTLLLQQLTVTPASAGMVTLTAECLTNNARVKRILIRSGLPLQTEVGPGVIGVRLSLDELALARLSTARRPSTRTPASAVRGGRFAVGRPTPTTATSA